MAANIKTLKEDNGDITYPQTIADAVANANGGTLQTFLNNGVTAEVIASTEPLATTVPASIIDWSSMPVKQTISSFANFGSSGIFQVTLTRYGNLVFAYFNVVLSGSISSYDQQNSGTCPPGYRPVYDSMIVGNASAGASVTACFQFYVQPSGQVRVSTGGSSGQTRYQGAGVWFTNDAMPS